MHWNPREAYDGIIDTFDLNNGRVHVTYDDFTSSAFAPCRAAAEEERRPLGVALGSSVVVEGGSVVVPSGAGGVSATSSDMLGR